MISRIDWNLGIEFLMSDLWYFQNDNTGTLVVGNQNGNTVRNGKNFNHTILGNYVVHMHVRVFSHPFSSSGWIMGRVARYRPTTIPNIQNLKIEELRFD